MKRAKRSGVVQTFDPEDFDIHANEEGIRAKVWPLKRGEPLVRVEKDLNWFKGKEKMDESAQNKSVLVTLLSNILIPGLGNAYVQRTPFSISILVLSLFVIFTTFSPIFPIVSLLSAAHIAQPADVEGAMLTLFVPSNVALENQVLLVGPTFSILAVPLLLSWIHLLFLFLNSPSKIKWKP